MNYKRDIFEKLRKDYPPIMGGTYEYADEHGMVILHGMFFFDELIKIVECLAREHERETKILNEIANAIEKMYKAPHLKSDDSPQLELQYDI